MAKNKKTKVARRDFLRGAVAGAAGAAALTVNPSSLAASPAEARWAGPPSMLPEAETETPVRTSVLTENRSGSDFMVDVIKSSESSMSAQTQGRVFVVCTSRSSITV